MDYREKAREIKADAMKLGAVSGEVRNKALLAIKEALLARKKKFSRPIGRISFGENKKSLQGRSWGV